MMNTLSVDRSVSHHTFFGISALLFIGSAALTIAWCGSMSAMGGMPMPGGWTMSMAWMRMPEQTWGEAAVAFIAMWSVMMVAMMLPSLVPMLWRYRLAVSAGAHKIAMRLDALTAIVAAGYFFVWTAIGIIVFPLGVALAEIEMQQEMVSRAVPFTGGIVILIAGVLQFTAWKAHALASCREGHCHALPPEAGITAGIAAGTAWRHGLHLGLLCSRACVGPMAILLVLGVMDLRAMALVTAMISVERLAPSSARAARAIGGFVIAVGTLLILRAVSSA